MSTRHLVVVSAGMSSPSSTSRLADQLAGATTAAVTARGESLEVTNIELRRLAADMAAAVATPGMNTAQLDEARSQLSTADGLIAVTPVFQASYAGLFKLFFDLVTPTDVAGLPTLIAATAGSPRHSLMLEHAVRPLFSYLRAVVVPTAVFSATEDYGTHEGLALPGRIDRAAGELAELMVRQATSVSGLGGQTATQDAGAQRGTNTRSGADFTSFAQLLAGYDGTTD